MRELLLLSMATVSQSCRRASSLSYVEGQTEAHRTSAKKGCNSELLQEKTNNKTYTHTHLYMVDKAHMAK